MTNPLLAPLLGILGVLIGVVGNSVATSRREARAFAREKKLELYLDLQNEEYELRDRRRELWSDRPVGAEWGEVNARWASLQLRSRLFANRRIQRLARSYYMRMSQWVRSAQRYADDPGSATGPRVPEHSAEPSVGTWLPAPARGMARTSRPLVEI